MHIPLLGLGFRDFRILHIFLLIFTSNKSIFQSEIRFFGVGDRSNHHLFSKFFRNTSSNIKRGGLKGGTLNFFAIFKSDGDLFFRLRLEEFLLFLEKFIKKFNSMREKVRCLGFSKRTSDFCELGDFTLCRFFSSFASFH